MTKAVELAQQSFPAIEAARARIATQEARARAAFAPYLPNAGLAGGTHFSLSNAAPSRDSAGEITYPFASSLSYSASLSAAHTLFDFGAREGTYESARSSVESLEADEATLRLDVELRVFEAYSTALRAKALEAVQERSIREVQRQLKRANALRVLDLRSEIDLFAAETRLGVAELGLVDAQNATALAMVSLADAIGKPDLTGAELQDFVLGPLPVDSTREKDVRAELQGRAELRSVRAGLKAAEWALSSLEAAHAPVIGVDLGATAGGNDDRLGPSVSVVAGLNVRYSLFSGFAISEEVLAARSRVQEAKAAVASVELALETELSRALASVKSAQSRLEAATRLRQHAEKQLRLAQVRYETQVGNHVELISALDGLVSAMSGELGATYGLSTARARLLRGLGRPLGSVPGGPSPWTAAALEGTVPSP